MTTYKNKKHLIPHNSQKPKTIQEIEQIVDKILEKNKEKLQTLTKKHHTPKPHTTYEKNKNQIDFNTYNNDVFNKKSIYFVKTKDEEESTKPTKTTKKISKEDKEIYTKLGSVSKDEANWLDERIKKEPKDETDVENKDFVDKILSKTHKTLPKIEDHDESTNQTQEIDSGSSQLQQVITQEKKPNEEIEESTPSEITEHLSPIFKDIQSIDQKTAQYLFDQGYTDIEKLVTISKKELQELPTLDKKTGIEIYKEIQNLWKTKYKNQQISQKSTDPKYKTTQQKKRFSKLSIKKPQTKPMNSAQQEKDDTTQPKTIKSLLKQEKKPIKEKKKKSTESIISDLHKDTMLTELQKEIKIDPLQLKNQTLQKMELATKTWEELDFYPLIEPFAYVEILRDKETLDKRYILIEAEMTDRENRIHKFLLESFQGMKININELETKGEDSYLKEKIEQIVNDHMILIHEQSMKKIEYYVEKELLGLGKLEPLMRDPNIEDISCDGSTIPIFLYHRKYGSLKSSVHFEEDENLNSFVTRLAQKCGRHISIAKPMLDATMPDGSRIQMTLSTEVTTKGSTFTIRKFKEDPFTPPDLIEFNTMSSEMVSYMWMAVENGVNALIAGGTAAGKTSALNAMCLFIPRESKIVSIEETREINLPHPNWIPGVARSGFGEVVGNKVIGEIDLYDLMKAALRQRPEYILVGEIRGREAYVLFQAMATGHTTYSTVHADSAQSLIHRLEGKPINIPRIMLQALDIVCIQVISRVKNKRARRCKQIIEIIDIDPTTKEILTNEVFRWDPVEDRFIYSGKSYVLERVRAEKDLSREQIIEELKNRASLLEWMNNNNIREFKKVAVLAAQYIEDPNTVMKKINNKT